MLGDTRIHAGIPTHATQDTSRGLMMIRTGLSPSKVSRSRLLSLNHKTPDRRPYTTCPVAGIQFGLLRVRSPLLT